MTGELRKQVALEYLKSLDNGGVTSSGEPILELFAPDAQVYFPKWGVAPGRNRSRGFSTMWALRSSPLLTITPD
jgi:hypothetical protein